MSATLSTRAQSETAIFAHQMPLAHLCLFWKPTWLPAVHGCLFPGATDKSFALETLPLLALASYPHRSTFMTSPMSVTHHSHLSCIRRMKLIQRPPSCDVTSWIWHDSTCTTAPIWITGFNVIDGTRNFVVRRLLVSFGLLTMHIRPTRRFIDVVSTSRLNATTSRALHQVADCV